MTKTELRVLQLLTNNGDRLKLSQLSPQMSRYSAEERGRALASLEDLTLVSSAQVPHSGPPGGVPGVVYWLTPAGLEHVAELKKQGRLKAAKRGSK